MHSSDIGSRDRQGNGFCKHAAIAFCDHDGRLHSIRVIHTARISNRRRGRLLSKLAGSEITLERGVQDDVLSMHAIMVVCVSR